MERFIVIAAAGAIGTAFYIWFSQMMKKQSMHDYIYAHQWLLHPNAICYWRTGMAFVGLVLYFFTGFQAAAIFIFTFAAILDGVDGYKADLRGAFLTEASAVGADLSSVDFRGGDLRAVHAGLRRPSAAGSWADPGVGDARRP